MPNMIDLTGHKYNEFTVLFCVGKNKYRNYLWECKCSCGKITTVSSGSLRRGQTKSCGHLRGRVIQHGGACRESWSKEYRAWTYMKARCNNKNVKSYNNYGGRGIKICKRWLNSFSNFLQDIGEAPSSKHSLDRIDVDGDYTPQNCRWATWNEQCNNKRNTFRMKDGSSLKQYCDKHGLTYKVVHLRIQRGWSLDEALAGKRYN